MRVRGARFLLNVPGVQSTAAIVAEVEDSRRWRPGKDGQGHDLTLESDGEWTCQPCVTFSIANCDRSVAFAFDWATGAGRRGSLVKVDRMIAALVAFRVGLEEEQRLYVERVRAVRRADRLKAAIEGRSDGEKSV